jgi:hypothetical protein
MEVSLEDVRHALVTSGSRNSYKLIEGISSGGFGLVVKAKHVPSDEVVAIKFIDCRSGLPWPHLAARRQPRGRQPARARPRVEPSSRLCAGTSRAQGLWCARY